MPKYIVTVIATHTQNAYLTVEADNPMQARDLAEERAKASNEVIEWVDSDFADISSGEVEEVQ